VSFRGGFIRNASKKLAPRYSLNSLNCGPRMQAKEEGGRGTFPRPLKEPATAHSSARSSATTGSPNKSAAVAWVWFTVPTTNTSTGPNRHGR